jgi:hypothetical protein
VGLLSLCPAVGCSRELGCACVDVVCFCRIGGRAQSCEMNAMTDATTYLLWALAILGAWNGINMIARLCAGAYPWAHGWSVFIGVWAGLILVYR